jgi:hypothetical protein
MHPASAPAQDRRRRSLATCAACCHCLSTGAFCTALAFASKGTLTAEAGQPRISVLQMSADRSGALSGACDSTWATTGETEPCQSKSHERQ